MTNSLLKNISVNHTLSLIIKSQRLFTLAFFVAIWGCSGDEKYRKNTTETLKKDIQQIETDSVVVERAEDLPVAVVEIRAVGNSPESMAFNMKEIKVKPGTMVKLKLVNEGQDWEMMHNIVFTTKGEAEAVAKAGAKLGAAGKYVPDMPAVVAASPIAKPGQTVRFEFRAPPSGEYDFICTYPDHYHRMKGTMVVK